jgi:hypothetical protein
MMMRDNVWRLVNTVVRPLNPPIVGELDDVALERIKVLSIIGLKCKEDICQGIKDVQHLPKGLQTFPTLFGFTCRPNILFGSSFLTHFSIDFALQMKTRCLIVEERARIVRMHQGGTKDVEIVATLSHPKSIVNFVFNEFECCGSVDYPKSIRCLQKLSERSIRAITCELM